MLGFTVSSSLWEDGDDRNESVKNNFKKYISFGGGMNGCEKK